MASALLRANAREYPSLANSFATSAPVPLPAPTTTAHRVFVIVTFFIALFPFFFMRAPAIAITNDDHD
jgi:hypothetical protein